MCKILDGHGDGVADVGRVPLRAEVRSVVVQPAPNELRHLIRVGGVTDSSSVRFAVHAFSRDARLGNLYSGVARFARLGHPRGGSYGSLRHSND